MYKFLNQKLKKKIYSLQNEFEKISLLVTKNFFYDFFWFHEISRLDLRPWSGIDLNKIHRLKSSKLIFFLNFLKEISKIINFTFRGIWEKKINLKSHNLIVIENVRIKDLKPIEFYFKGIENKILKKKILYLTLEKINHKKNSLDLNNLINQKEKFVCFFLSIKSFLKTFIIINNLKKRKKISSFWIEYFFLKESILKLYINFLTFRYFRNECHFKNIIIPYEEKTSERSIIYGINKNKKNQNLKIYSFCINPQHNLSIFLNDFSKLKIPRSNNYLFCGPLYQNYFKDLNRVNKLNINDIGSNKWNVKNYKYKKNKDYLVLLSHINEFYELAKYQEELNKLKKYNFILRPYPHASDINLIKAHIENNSLLNFRISNNSLINDIKKSFAVIFCATSAGLEAISYGRIGLWSNFSKVGINPMFNRIDLFNPSFNAKQLLKKMESIDKMSLLDLNKKIKKQQVFCNRIYSKINKNLINKYFNDEK